MLGLLRDCLLREGDTTYFGPAILQYVNETFRMMVKLTKHVICFRLAKSLKVMYELDVKLARGHATIGSDQLNRYLLRRVSLHRTAADCSEVHGGADREAMQLECPHDRTQLSVRNCTVPAIWVQRLRFEVPDPSRNERWVKKATVSNILSVWERICVGIW